MMPPLTSIDSLFNKAKTTLFSFFQKKSNQIEYQDFVYNLGNDFKTTDPREATEEFLKREFPQILESQNQPHDVIFIPDTFLYGPIARKVFFNSTYFQARVL